MAVCNFSFFPFLFGAEYVLVGSVLRKQYVGNDFIFPIALVENKVFFFFLFCKIV